MAGNVQPFAARMRFMSHDVASNFLTVFDHPAPSLAAPPFHFPAPIPFSLPTWASTSTPVLAPHRRIPHAPLPTPMPVPEIPRGPISPAPEESPSPATPAAPPTTVAPASPTTPTTTVVAPATDAASAPAPDAISMARIIPTDAQRSTHSALEGAVRPFTGPWAAMARTITVARLDPRWDPSVLRQETRKREADAEEAPSPKRARIEERLGEAAVGASAVGGTREGEGEEGELMETEIGTSAGTEGTWSLESGFGPIAPMPAPGPVEAAGGLHSILVVIPQVDGNALHQHNYTSTTSTHRVDNPAGEFVIEPVPLPSGGPSTSPSADDHQDASEPIEDEDEEDQLRLGDETTLSQREAAVVIDENIYGGDIMRCVPCNKTFRRKYDRRRHVVTVHYLGKFPCDWCELYFYTRRDGITRHKKGNCPAKDFEDRHTNPWRWFMAWVNGPRRGGRRRRGTAGSTRRRSS